MAVDLSERQIDAIVDSVVSQLGLPSPAIQKPAAPKTIKAVSAIEPLAHRGCFMEMEEAIFATEKAYHQFREVKLETRRAIIENIRALCLAATETLSKMAVEETGLGRFKDKIKKNELAILKTPGTEDLTPIAFTGDDGLTLLELAPYGIIGSITPCTNPSETIISNTIAMIAGGNAVIFNPHPSAKKISAFTVDLINQAIISAGGPPNLVSTIINPTIQSAQKLMTHSKINLLVVTGGPAVVETAMKSGKKVIAAGPGNPPVVVDDTADLEKAARDIVMSASTDNNIICLIEKNIIVLDSVADTFKKYLVQYGAVALTGLQTKQLEKVVVDQDHPSKNCVGKDVQVILKMIGLDVDDSKRLAIAEVDAQHPFATIELLMPVLPFIRVKTFDEAVEVAYQLENRRGHTAVIHSKNIDRMHQMACKMNTAIFVKNGPALAGLGLGGEGPASFTIAGSTGEGVTTARHFVKVRRCVLTGYFRIT